MIVDFIVGVGLCLFFLVMSWLYARAIRGGQPLTTTQKKMILFSFVFVVGTIFLEAVGGSRGWRLRFIVALIAVWGLAVVGFLVWRYYRHRKQTADGR